MRSCFIFFLFFLTISPSDALDKITLTIPKAGGGGKLLAVTETGKSNSVVIPAKGGKISITPLASNVFLYQVIDNKVARQVVNKMCHNSKSGTDCGEKDKVTTLFRAGATLGTVKVLDGALLTNKVGVDYQKTIVSKFQTRATNYVPKGIKTAGLGVFVAGSVIVVRSASSDGDGDGLVDALDADDDNDTVLDNYDRSPGTGTATGFKVFSNLKLDIDRSVNLHTTGLSPERVDSALQSAQTLAIEVAGEPTDSVELDCGTLSYCSREGTGTSGPGGTPFPGAGGSTTDADDDGFGTLSKGPTGDFQLRTGATSTAISSGDLLSEIVTSKSNKSSTIPGILNFVFTSNPALKEITVSNGTINRTSTINYAATPVLGSRNNCLTAPASGNISLSITGWRPQRKGILEAGEAEFMDLGHSQISIDIPDLPCAQSGTCPAAFGPGHCSVSSYFESDPNLSIASGLDIVDARGDVDADPANTYTFGVNLATCLGSISWEPGQTLFLDLQFASANGDNAAQKFCITRDGQ